MNKFYSPCSKGSLKIGSLISTFIFRPMLRRFLGVDVRLNVGVESSIKKVKKISNYKIATSKNLFLN